MPAQGNKKNFYFLGAAGSALLVGITRVRYRTDDVEIRRLQPLSLPTDPDQLALSKWPENPDYPVVGWLIFYIILS
jgi:hypothetical protein